MTERLEKTALLLVNDFKESQEIINEANGGLGALSTAGEVGIVVSDAVKALQKAKDAFDVFKKAHALHKVGKHGAAMLQHGKALLHVADAVSAAHEAGNIVKKYHDAEEHVKKTREEKKRKRKMKRGVAGSETIVSARSNKSFTKKSKKLKEDLDGVIRAILIDFPKNPTKEDAMLVEALVDHLKTAGAGAALVLATAGAANELENARKHMVRGYKLHREGKHKEALKHDGIAALHLAAATVHAAAVGTAFSRRNHNEQ